MLISRQSGTSRSSHAAAGFTILELLIATAIFSIILLVVTAGVISFTRQYYKGILSSRTQEAARSVMSEIVQSIQFGATINAGLATSPVSSTKGVCIDNKLISYVIGQQVSDSGTNVAKHQDYHGVVVNPTAGFCSPSTLAQQVPSTSGLPVGQRELLGNHMRLSALSVLPDATDPSLYTVHVRVIYGDDDLLTPTVTAATSAWDLEKCDGTVSGAQFCAVSDLTTTVQKRLQ